MKKCIIVILVCVILSFLLKYYVLYEQKPYVSDNGWLKVQNGKLKNEKNRKVVLKGISSHGLQWYSDLLTDNNLQSLKNDWNINVFRIAMYTDEDGYISNKDEIKQKLIDVANTIISLDMYVIIDWHTLKDNDPNTYITESKEFFDEISLLYKDSPNVIYEICNEPNGASVTWNDSVKPYAEEIIPIIRKNSPNSVIIVGTPNWCRDLKSVVDNPLDFKNVLYSCHFYAGSHDKILQDEIDYALSKRLPVFISEWGTTDSSGDGDLYLDKSTEWIEFLNKRHLSWVNWSFSNKAEGSAIIDESYVEDEDSDFNDYLTESGKFVKDILNSEK